LVVVIALSALSAGMFSAEHLLNNRDPGVYVTTSRWFADEETLLVSGKVGGFEGIDEIRADSLRSGMERARGETRRRLR
jgi:hypothetical protein